MDLSPITDTNVRGFPFRASSFILERQMRNTLLHVAEHGLAWVALGALACTCACASVTSRAREGRIDDAWKKLCDDKVEARATSLATAGTPADRLALRAALRARTTAELQGRAISSEDVSARIGEQLFPRKALLLELRLRVARHHAAGLSFQARLSVHEGAPGPARTWCAVTGRGLWTFAGQIPPTPATAKVNQLGKVLDFFTRLGTLGLGDFGLRHGTKPGTPGGGTPRQSAALEMLSQTSELCVATDDTPCEQTFVLGPDADVAPHRRAEDIDEAGIFLNQRGAPEPGDSDALILKLIHLADGAAGPRACDWIDEIALPLPPGRSTVDRLNALFARGPIELPLGGK